MDKETPEDISSVTVGLWRKSRYQFYLCRNKSADIMKERCEVSSKNLLKNFSRHEMFLVISRCLKGLVMSTPKPDNFM